MKAKILSLSIILLFLFSGTCQAKFFGIKFYPDSPFYFLEKIVDGIEYTIANPDARAKICLGNARERLQEIEYMLEKHGKVDEELLREYDKEMNKSFEHGMKISSLAKKQEILKLIEEATTYHKSVLEKIEGKVSEQARKKIEMIIEDHEEYKHSFQKEIMQKKEVNEDIVEYLNDILNQYAGKSYATIPQDLNEVVLIRVYSEDEVIFSTTISVRNQKVEVTNENPTLIIEVDKEVIEDCKGKDFEHCKKYFFTGKVKVSPISKVLTILPKISQ